MLHLIRYQEEQKNYWGLVEGQAVRPLELPCTTTAALLAVPRTELLKAASTATPKALADLQLLSPITKPQQVLCQGTNYRQHMLESGVDPDAQNFNLFFTKSSTSVCGPSGSILRPPHVRLLDYEIELTLVLGKHTCGTQNITAQNLHEYVAGICIGNDISARDIQIPQMQFHKGKSYRTFCPLGPVLCLLEQKDMHYLDELQLELRVNGAIRQQDSTRNMVFKPAATLAEYSQICDFNPGDVLLTGTPAGCALSIPSPLLVRIASLLPEQKKWQLFIKKQLSVSKYLNLGDKVESRIFSTDGKLDLGVQSHTISSAAL